MNAIPCSAAATSEAVRSYRSFEESRPAVLEHIYRDDAAIVIWRRELSQKLQTAARFLLQNRALKLSITVMPQDALVAISAALDKPDKAMALSADAARLVDQFCRLFALSRARLSLSTLDRTMCPRFHVDRVPCRLVTTYQGPATEWLRHDAVDRTKLGLGNAGLADERSGLFAGKHAIQRLNCGDVALLKGELWRDYEGVGLVHRSPDADADRPRLFLSVNFPT